MVRRFALLALLLAAVLLVPLASTLPSGRGRAAEVALARPLPSGPGRAAEVLPEATRLGSQPNAFYDPNLFFPGLQAAEREKAESEGPLTGGLVPHHDLAAPLLSRFFLQLEPHPPTTVIVVGPNHENRGQPIITGRRGWQTDFGVVEADLTLVDSLAKAGLAVVDDTALSTEHSVGTLMPYLKYHAPEARVVPVILHRDVPMQDLRRLAGALAGYLTGDRLLIASVDFSHYLTRAEAEQKDVVTLQAIQSADLEALMRMGPDHLDSPGSLSVLLLAMQQAGARGPNLTGHTNSGVILRSDTVETTSYFTFTFH